MLGHEFSTGTSHNVPRRGKINYHELILVLLEKGIELVLVLDKLHFATGFWQREREYTIDEFALRAGFTCTFSKWILFVG